jgi:FlaA1/EpsC-like NDP-sugar epimerase
MIVSPRHVPAAPPTWWGSVAQRSVKGPADIALVLLDVTLVVGSYLAMLILRFELDVPNEAWDGFIAFLLAAVALHLLMNRVLGLYGPVWQQASILEAQRILLSGLLSTLLLFIGVVVLDRYAPLSVVLTGGLVATGLMGVLRFQSRLFAFHRRGAGDATRVLMAGAGESAGAILRELSRQPEAGIRVVALLDDDPRKLGRWLGAVPIAGTLDELVPVGEQFAVEQVLLAIPSADSELVRKVADASAQLGVALKVLPSVAELMHGQPNLRDVRDLSIDDLLGRQPISTDLASVKALVHGRRVLVTGGGGSIGSEIVRQIAAYDPARLLVLDRDETHLFDAMAAIDGRGEPVLLDIRDREGVFDLLRRERPEILFHAAANKHVPLLEAHPREAAATNVLGTANLVDAAREFRTPRVVFISTDKAVNPSSVMGASKAVGEQLVLTEAPHGAAWCAVRFGNVLGSRGSVVPTFMRQIRQGGPVTVTHPEVTRYFMSIPEAVQLVLQAAALAESHDIFMLEMGHPVKILDLANRMVALAGLRVGTDIELQVTGLRPGEKLAEELHSVSEHPLPTSHPKIVRLHPLLPEPGALRAALKQIGSAVDAREDERLARLLFTVAGLGLDFVAAVEMRTGDQHTDD